VVWVGKLFFCVLNEFKVNQAINKVFEPAKTAVFYFWYGCGKVYEVL